MTNVLTLRQYRKRQKKTKIHTVHWKVKIFNNNILWRKVCLVMFLT